MAVPTISVTFKQTEMDLYKRIRQFSSPAAFLKDCAIEHFQKLDEAQTAQPQQFSPDFKDEIEVF